MMEAVSPSETSFLTTVTRRNIPEDGILHSHRRGNLKSRKGMYRKCAKYNGVMLAHVDGTWHVRLVCCIHCYH
jgi:hypothetical protein